MAQLVFIVQPVDGVAALAIVEAGTGATVAATTATVAAGATTAAVTTTAARCGIKKKGTRIIGGAETAVSSTTVLIKIPYQNQLLYLSALIKIEKLIPVSYSDQGCTIYNDDNNV